MTDNAHSVPPDNVVHICNQLRAAFQRKRYGSGEYDPDFDLFDVAADRIEGLLNAISQAYDALGNEDACEPYQDASDILSPIIQVIDLTSPPVMYEPSLADLRQMVAAIGIGIKADDKTMSGLMQAARIGWDYGFGRKVRMKGVRLTGSSDGR